MEEFKRLEAELEVASQKAVKSTFSFLKWMLLWIFILVLTMAAHFLIFPFWLRALARSLNVEHYASTYMDLYQIAVGLMVVSLVCILLVWISVPYWVLTFITMPLNAISFLVGIGMQYELIKLLSALREEIGTRI